jgi:hypothetical protein
MPEDEGYEEKLWPDGYKAVIKSQVREVIASKLHFEDTLKNAYELHYKEKYSNFEQFLERVTEMLVIGAEKGGDKAFDDIVTAFLYELPLPEPRIYGRYLLMSKLPDAVRGQMAQQIIEDYRGDEVFIHAYKVGYWDLYEDYEQFLAETTVLASVGVINGIDDMLTGIFRAFATAGPLPPARRNAKRVKNWFVPKGSKIRDVPISRRARKRRRGENIDAENSNLR